MLKRGLILAAIIHCIVGPPVDKKKPGQFQLKMEMEFLGIIWPKTKLGC